MFSVRVKLWRLLSIGFGLGMAAALLILLPTPGSAQTLKNSPAPALPPPNAANLTNFVYARVITGNVPVYGHPGHAAQGLAPARTLDEGYVWVTLHTRQPTLHQEQVWYAINPDEFVQSDYLTVVPPSKFHGITVVNPTPFAWIVFDTWTAPAAAALPDDSAILLERYMLVNIYETRRVEGRDWYRVGDSHWVEQGMVGIVAPKPRPAGVGPHEQWIEVDLYEQTLAAYEGDQMVYATLISSGLDWWRTETGLFRIWVKVKNNKMSGREGYTDYYFLEDVPWTMYFNRDFALHGAYWHDRFGVKHSHGCVNLSLADSRWLYNWATPSGSTGWVLPNEDNQGTWVWVHDRETQEQE